MSTRSKTRSSRVSESTSVSQKSKNRIAANSTHSDDMDVDVRMGEGKDNVEAVIYKASMPPPSRTWTTRPRRAKVRESLRTVDCICTKGNDGSPMIFCSKCHIWYHFTCVDLTEPDAEEISAYVCPTCTESTGCHSAMAWEGDDAVAENTDDDLAIAARRQAALKNHKKPTDPKPIVGDSDESSSSEDEYVEENDDNKGKVRDKLKGRLHRLSIVSDTDSIAASSRRNSKHSASPSPSVQHLKRKSVTVQHSYSPPPSKKKKSKESAVDDPVRKYCLSKLEELFKDVFLRYPHIEVLNDVSETPRFEAKKLEELSDEEKDALLKRSEQFSQDLEKCVFDIYAEPDRNGQPHASGKYKERFRMLQFNLSKVDRVIIHQRITSGTISPKEISLMSSTDLADEETKQSIKLAEKEALEHSILLKSTMPRAKITHKGLQDIEDVNGEVATAHEIEVNKEREQEEEERRERERMARLRTSQRQRTASVSVPPESPSVHSSTASLMGEQLWGGPPPVPVHAMSPTVSDFSGSGSRPPLFMHTSDLNTTELELNLADLINIDDEQDSTNHMPMFNIGTNIVPSPVDAGQSAPSFVTPTGISPFAARPERQRGASFDLNSLWNMAKDDVQQSEASPAAEPPASETATVPTPTEDAQDDGSDKDEAMELESVEANDQDFDMFLEEKEPEPEQNEELIVTPIPPRNIDALPQVWKGTLSMPLDSTVPQETFLVARQIAGRPLPAESPLWKTLFPSDNLRIEGRVAVDNSIKYLVGMRLNAAKELYAAAFTPSAPEHDGDFKAFCNFLIAKGRHGLVFPWGSRPKDYHPGRELYMVPLLQTDPLPEFVELLDELKLPKIRDKDYLLGIWILNKGKLAVLPSLPAPPASIPVITSQPSQSHSPPIIPPLFSNLPPPPVSMPQPQPQPQPPQIPMPPPTIPGLPIAPSALAAEVASLTPEQLQEVLRTLSSTMLPSLTQPASYTQLPQFNPMQQPPIHHTTPPIGVPTPSMGQTPPSIPPAQSAWIPPPMAPYSNYPPPNVPFQQPPAHNAHNVHNAPHDGPILPPFDRQGQGQGHDRQDYNRQNSSRDYQPQSGHTYQQGGNRNTSERGWRGNSGNRGGNPRHSNQGQRNNRGRGGGGGGGGGGDGHDFNNRRDSGWPRRQRNEGHSGPSW